MGAAPRLKKKKWKIDASNKMYHVVKFLRKQLFKNDQNEEENNENNLFLYCNNYGFAPSPNQVLGDLYLCFGVKEELVIRYAFQECFG